MLANSLPDASSPGPRPDRRTTPEGGTEEAFFFGPAAAPLYGVLHAPPAAAGLGAPLPPIVHVHGYGIEQVAAHRIEVEFARAAAAAGFPVFRFHMTGSGDSWGDPAAATIEAMVSDVVAAVAHLAGRDRGRFAGSPVLLGVRLGCDIALRAAVRLGGVRGLVLWEPVGEPRAYFDSILRSRLISALAQGVKTGETVAGLVETLRAEGVVDVLGYPIHRLIYEEATPLALPEGAPIAGHALFVSIGKRVRPPARIAELSRLLGERGAVCETRELREEAAWQFNSNPSFVSPALTEMTLSWCRERWGLPAAAAHASATPPAAARTR